MQPQPSPTDTNLPTSRKRTASSISPPSHPPASDSTTPRILNRRHHRRHNTALSTWGPDIPLTSQAPTSTIPPRPFNIYKSLLRHPNLFFPLVLRFPLSSAISLYAIDKEFHYLFNKYSVSLLHDYARYWAPVASRVFSWILFPGLCISDPMLRPMDGREWLARDVPGWRWVGMVLGRQGVVRQIITSELGLEGVRGMEEVLCKFWVVMEFRYSHVRLSFLQDRGIWSDEDISMFQMFLVRLDMRFSDPVLGNGACCLSHLLLTQPSLNALHKVLTSKTRMSYDTVTRLLVIAFPMDDLDIDTFPWLDDENDNGVSEEHWGILTKEGWMQSGSPMESAVDMVITEGIRRELHVQQWLLDFVLYGYVNKSGRDVPLVRKWRNRGLKEYEGWLGKKERDKVVEDLDERFGLMRTAKGDLGDEEMDLSE